VIAYKLRQTYLVELERVIGIIVWNFEEISYEHMVYEHMVYERMVYERMVYERMVYERMVYERMVYEHMVYERRVIHLRLHANDSNSGPFSAYVNGNSTSQTLTSVTRGPYYYYYY